MVSVCMPSCNTYHLTWVSLTLRVGYLFTAAPAKCSRCSLPWMRGISSLPPFLTFNSQKTSQSNHTRATALSNSMKLNHARGASQDGRVMVERSDRMWSTGEGNGKPLQYSCLENPMNSMKRQNDRILTEKLPGQSVPSMLLEISGEITPERMKEWSQSKKNTQLWM